MNKTAVKEPTREMFEKEVKDNYNFFLKQDFKPEDRGKFALLKSKQLIAILDTRSDAIKMGDALFIKEDKVYSVQQIDAAVMDLGYMSYALPSS